jgi:pimeloyl-ACP methyl ester carboxylesterase
MTRTSVVFLHGIGGAARGFTPQVESFTAAGFHAVAANLLGYGGRPPVDRMDFESLAADVETFIARERLERPVIVGHSLGGMIAQTLLRRGPNGYRAAVLACTSPAFGDPAGEFQRKFVADRLAPLDAGLSLAELAADMVDRVIGNNPDTAGRQLAIETLAQTPARTYRAAVNCLVTFDERANLGRIRLPVLCLAGEHDRNASPAMMERMAAKIPDARYVCLPGAGHLPNLEMPRAFNTAIFAFLSQVLAPAESGSNA